MKAFELEKIIKKIVGLKLDNVCWACEMLMFRFGQYALNVECLARIIKTMIFLLLLLTILVTENTKRILMDGIILINIEM